MRKDIIKSFRVFEEELNSGLTQEQIGILDRCVSGKWRVNPQTGLVDVEGNVDMSDLKMKEIPVNFGQVSEDFDCSYNELTSLVGAPEKVGGNFLCFRNELTSLEGAPQEVGGHFTCSWNNLTSLEGAPLKVLEFYCYNNNLTSLKGSPMEIENGFNCSLNNLTSLVGAPKEVGGSFDCSRNNLTSLEGSPGEVGGDFNCINNRLTTLKGSPRKVGGNFYCSINDFISLDGASPEIEGGFTKDKINIPPRHWNMGGILDAFVRSDEKDKKLLISLLNPELLNREIQKNTPGMMMKLKGVWNDPDFREIRDQLVIPDNLKGEMDLLGDMDGLGF